MDMGRRKRPVNICVQAGEGGRCPFSPRAARDARSPTPARSPTRRVSPACAASASGGAGPVSASGARRRGRRPGRSGGRGTTGTLLAMCGLRSRRHAAPSRRPAGIGRTLRRRPGPARPGRTDEEGPAGLPTCRLRTTAWPRLATGAPPGGAGSAASRWAGPAWSRRPGSALRGCTNCFKALPSRRWTAGSPRGCRRGWRTRRTRSRCAG